MKFISDYDKVLAKKFGLKILPSYDETTHPHHVGYKDHCYSQPAVIVLTKHRSLEAPLFVWKSTSDGPWGRPNVEQLWKLVQLRRNGESVPDSFITSFTAPQAKQ